MYIIAVLKSRKGLNKKNTLISQYVLKHKKLYNLKSKKLILLKKVQGFWSTHLYIIDSYRTYL